MKALMLLVFCFLLSLPLSSANSADSFLSNRTIVDLSHTYKADMPVYPGGVPFNLENLATIDQGYYINKFSTGEHVGTHIDAPSHFSATGAHVSEIPLEELVGPLVVLDLSEKAKTNPDLEVSEQDIFDWEETHGTIPAGAFVICNSGWWKKWDNPEAYLGLDSEGKLRFPGFSKKAVEFLLRERDIKGVGTDTLSTDHGSSHTFDEHHLLLGAGKINIENLTNLDKIPVLGATLVVAPLNIESGSGAPARVFAFVPKN